MAQKYYVQDTKEHGSYSRGHRADANADSLENIIGLAIRSSLFLCFLLVFCIVYSKVRWNDKYTLSMLLFLLLHTAVNVSASILTIT